MPTIKPFQAFRYAGKYFRRLPHLACPPYDVISKKEQAVLKRSHRHNFCNILLTDGNNDYKALGARFRKWLKDDVLVQEAKPCLYLYEQVFSVEKRRAKRIGLLCLLKINQQGLVTPHENTFKGPKRDRYHILKELKANLTPIFTIIPGKLSILQLLSRRYAKEKPFMRFKDRGGVTNRVWRIDDQRLIGRIQRAVGTRRLFIADGHHRFEVAYRYFQSMHGKSNFKDLNYILAYLTDSQSGIEVFATHRLLRTPLPKKEVLRRISQCFYVRQVKKTLFLKALKNSTDVPFGVSHEGKYFLLRLKNPAVLDTISKKNKEEAYKELNVYILHKLIVPCLGESRIEYTHSLDEALARAKGNTWAFILKATDLKTILAIARKGYRLPQKTTYFYPKLLSGLVVRTFEKRNG